MADEDEVHECFTKMLPAGLISGVISAGILVGVRFAAEPICGHWSQWILIPVLMLVACGGICMGVVCAMSLAVSVAVLLEFVGGGIVELWGQIWRRLT